MNAAVIHSFHQPPRHGPFAEPAPQPGETLVAMSAAALSPLVRGQAAGRHYSSQAVFPFVPGIDGVGRRPTGERVYFAFPTFPFGAMAERVAVQDSLFVPVPDNVDDVTAAAIANPGMSSWAALTVRAKFISGETVLVNGATGSAGTLAVQIAKHLGAKKVIATGRNPARLAALPALGADLVISLERPEEELARTFRQEMDAGVDVILDYLWGKSAELILASLSGSGSGHAEARRRYVQIGAISGPTIALPAALLRSSGLELLGSGLGSISHEALVSAIGELLNAVVPANLQIETEPVSLAEVEAAWTRDTGERRLVFTCP